VNAKKMDLTPIVIHNLSLTAQNIVVAFQIKREVLKAEDQKKEK